MKLLSNREFFGVDGDGNDSGDGVDDLDEDFLNFLNMFCLLVPNQIHPQSCFIVTLVTRKFCLF